MPFTRDEYREDDDVAGNWWYVVLTEHDGHAVTRAPEPRDRVISRHRTHEKAWAEAFKAEEKQA